MGCSSNTLTGSDSANLIFQKMFQNFLEHLTLSRRRPISYRNQSIDLKSKSRDWFLYDIGLRRQRLNRLVNKASLGKISWKASLEKISFVSWWKNFISNASKIEEAQTSFTCANFFTNFLLSYAKNLFCNFLKHGALELWKKFKEH